MAGVSPNREYDALIRRMCILFSENKSGKLKCAEIEGCFFPATGSHSLQSQKFCILLASRKGVELAQMI